MLLVGNVAVTSQPQVVAFSAVLVGMLSFICAYQMGKDTVRLYAKSKIFDILIAFQSMTSSNMYC